MRRFKKYICALLGHRWHRRNSGAYNCTRCWKYSNTEHLNGILRYRFWRQKRKRAEP